MARWLAIVGLVLNTVGALLLLRFQPVVPIYTKEGRTFSGWVNEPTELARRHYRIQTWGTRVAIGALALGFVLQLIALLTA